MGGGGGFQFYDPKYIIKLTDDICNLNWRGYAGNTLAMLTCLFELPHLTKKLLKNGYEINMANYRDETLISYAFIVEKTENLIVDLINKKAIVTLRKKDYFTERNNILGEHFFDLAIRFKKYRIVKYYYRLQFR